MHPTLWHKVNYTRISMRLAIYWVEWCEKKQSQMVFLLLHHNFYQVFHLHHNFSQVFPIQSWCNSSYWLVIYDSSASRSQYVTVRFSPNIYRRLPHLGHSWATLVRYGLPFWVQNLLHHDDVIKWLVTRSFDVFFDLRLNKRLSKQSWGWWFDMPSRPLWRHGNKIFAYLLMRMLPYDWLKGYWSWRWSVNTCEWGILMKFWHFSLSSSVHYSGTDIFITIIL